MRAHGAGAFLLFLALSLALQATSFGDTNRHADEAFYFLVGQRMHEGLLPYVDVWDRKPFGLFLIYYLIAGISASVWSYQIVACLFVAATAAVVSRVVAVWTTGSSAVLAGIAYILVVQPFEGGTGQAPDFYNLFIALAALLVIKELERLRSALWLSWRGWLAMASCGVAITVKQTSMFESMFFGLAILGGLYRAGYAPGRLVRTGLVFCVIGALPTALIALGYALAGHSREFWHAMVLSNIARQPIPGDELQAKALGLGVRLLALGPMAFAGVVGAGSARGFLVGWILAALVGFAVVPAFSIHYVLPLIVPLTVAAGLFLDRRNMRMFFFAILALYALIWSTPDKRAATRESIAGMEELTALVIGHDPGGGLLVFDGPPYLYATAGKRFLSPLVFPHHLNHQVENDVSHLGTHAEVDRILAAGPGVVVMSRAPRNRPVNAYSWDRVAAYVRQRCRFSRTVKLREGPALQDMVVWGDCAAPRSGSGGRIEGLR